MPIDYSKYPPNWKKEIRPRILARAGNCCEFCGVENGAVGWRGGDGSFIFAPDYAKSRANGGGFYVVKFCDPASNDGRIKIVLTIAHLDHDEENHDVQDGRLAALCQRCHLRYDAKEKARRLKLKTEAMKSAGLFG